MKKALLTLLFMGLSCTVMAVELDEMELNLLETVKWCHDQGMQQPHAQIALEWFNLEQKYLADLRWHRFLNKLTSECEDEDDDRSWFLSRLLKGQH